MVFEVKDILRHYKHEAEKHALRGTSTIQDIRTRNLEVKVILSYLHDKMHLLEVGCGNGYTAKKIIETFQVNIDAIDFSPQLIECARAQNISNARGTVRFHQQDILTFDVVNKYDGAFTERCLQNLPTWKDQQKALLNISRALKLDADFLMIESFHTGLDKLNAARAELDLDPIDPPWHNLFFKEQETISYCREIGLELVEQNSFLSGYYFGSRVLLPAITPATKKITSSSVLNDYFCALPPVDDFCPMKLIRFKKKEHRDHAD